MLILPIKAKWFNMILSGIKTEEYRELKPYWATRFRNAGLLDDDGPTGKTVNAYFINGYAARGPIIRAKVTLYISEGRPEWGAEPGKYYFVLFVFPDFASWDGYDRKQIFERAAG